MIPRVSVFSKAMANGNSISQRPGKPDGENVVSSILWGILTRYSLLASTFSLGVSATAQLDGC